MTTAQTVQGAGQTAGQLPELPLASPQAQSALRANSVPIAPATVASTAAAGHAQSPPPAAVRRLLARLDRALKGSSVLHAQPASMRQARDRHHEAARRWSAPVVRWARLVWAYLVHLPYRAVALTLDWVLDNPAKTAVAALVLFVIWHWH